MSEDIFAKALRNLTMDAAAGDAIRHLCDKGFTLTQIKETLTFPAPEEYIAEVMWARLLEKGIVRVREWESGTVLNSHLGIIETRDRYGRKSFLQVQKESPEENTFSPEDYVQYENLLVISSALEQVSSLSDHIPQKVRNTGSHRDT